MTVRVSWRPAPGSHQGAPRLSKAIEYGCYTAVTLLLHCCYTVVTLLLHCCYTRVTPGGATSKQGRCVVLEVDGYGVRVTVMVSKSDGYGDRE
jgi:hypothetical protein